MQPLSTLNLARRGAFMLQRRTAYTGTTGTVLSGPPLNRVSFAEKAALGGVMCVSLFAIPAWVLLNIRNYQGEGSE